MVTVSFFTPNGRIARTSNGPNYLLRVMSLLVLGSLVPTFLFYYRSLPHVALACIFPLSLPVFPESLAKSDKDSCHQFYMTYASQFNRLAAEFQYMLIFQRLHMVSIASRDDVKCHTVNFDSGKA